MTIERVLVTGATGFLGMPLVAKLVAGGAEVHAVARRPPRAAGGARWHRVDLEDAEATRRAVADIRPRRILHLASQVTGRRDLDLVVPTFGAGLAATVHLLTAATESGAGRIVLAGSMEEPEAGEPAGSPYAAAKAAERLYANFFHALYGTPVVSARIFMVYGPGQRDTSKVVPASIASALAGRRPRISSGARPVDWIYVEDAVDGLLALAERDDLVGETVDLGSGELATVRQVVETICRLVGSEGPEVGALPDRPLERVVRASRAETLAKLGWEPRVELAEGLARTIDWMRAGGSGAALRS